MVLLYLLLAAGYILIVFSARKSNKRGKSLTIKKLVACILNIPMSALLVFSVLTGTNGFMVILLPVFFIQMWLFFSSNYVSNQEQNKNITTQNNNVQTKQNNVVGNNNTTKVIPKITMQSTLEDLDNAINIKGQNIKQGIMSFTNSKKDLLMSFFIEDLQGYKDARKGWIIDETQSLEEKLRTVLSSAKDREANVIVRGFNSKTHEAVEFSFNPKQMEDRDIPELVAMLIKLVSVYNASVAIDYSSNLNGFNANILCMSVIPALMCKETIGIKFVNTLSLRNSIMRGKVYLGSISSIYELPCTDYNTWRFREPSKCLQGYLKFAKEDISVAFSAVEETPNRNEEYECVYSIDMNVSVADKVRLALKELTKFPAGSKCSIVCRNELFKCLGHQGLVEFEIANDTTFPDAVQQVLRAFMGWSNASVNLKINCAQPIAAEGANGNRIDSFRLPKNVFTSSFNFNNKSTDREEIFISNYDSECSNYIAGKNIVIVREYPTSYELLELFGVRNCNTAIKSANLLNLNISVVVEEITNHNNEGYYLLYVVEVKGTILRVASFSIDTNGAAEIAKLNRMGEVATITNSICAVLDCLGFKHIESIVPMGMFEPVTLARD